MKRCSLVIVLMFASAFAFAQNTFPALLADKPDGALQDKLKLFGQFVGSWQYEGVSLHDDGSRVTNKGEIHFHWVLGGTAIQDVWMDKEQTDAPAKAYGTTLRFYDPKTNTWRSTWINPGAGVVFPMIGRQVGSDIVIEGKKPSGQLIHWIFTDIKPDSFRWHAEKQVGDGWRTYEDISVKRIKERVE